jgi:hypothetical protein
LSDEHVIAMKAWRNRHHVLQAQPKQRRAGKQNKRERDLHDDESLAKALSGAAGRARAGFRSEGTLEMAAQMEPRDRHRDDDCQRNRAGEPGRRQPAIERNARPERQAIRFPEESGLSLAQVWQIAPGVADGQDVVFAGVEPAALFRSADAGESWEPVKGLLEHEHRPKWMPGGGGLCLHTIVQDRNDPKRMGIAISTAGFYRTDDGGESWRARNQGVRAVFLPNQLPEFGQCVHKVVNHSAKPERGP